MTPHSLAIDPPELPSGYSFDVRPPSTWTFLLFEQPKHQTVVRIVRRRFGWRTTISALSVDQSSTSDADVLRGLLRRTMNELAQGLDFILDNERAVNQVFRRTK